MRLSARRITVFFIIPAAIILIPVIYVLFFLRSIPNRFSTENVCIIATRGLHSDTRLFAKAATAIRTMSASCNSDPILIDTGGLISPGALRYLPDDKPLAPVSEFLIRSGYDRIAVSPRYFIPGATSLRSLIAETGVGVMTANMTGRIKTIRPPDNDQELSLTSLAAVDKHPLLPAFLFMETRFTPPLKHTSSHTTVADNSVDILFLQQPLARYFDRFTDMRTDFLISLHETRPGTDIVVFAGSNTLPRAKIDPARRHLVHPDGTILKISARIIRNRKTGTVIVNTETTHRDIVSFSPNQDMTEAMRPFMELKSAAAARKTNLHIPKPETASSRRKETPLHRLLHRALEHYAREFSDTTPEYTMVSIGTTDTIPATGQLTRKELNDIFPTVSFPVLIQIKGVLLTSLLSASCVDNAIPSVSLSPARYHVRQSGEITWDDGTPDESAEYTVMTTTDSVANSIGLLPDPVDIAMVFPADMADVLEEYGSDSDFHKPRWTCSHE